MGPHLEVDVPAAVAGEAGPLQLQQGLLVGPLDGEPGQAGVPVLFDVADGGAGRSLDLHLWVTYAQLNPHATKLESSASTLAH